MFIIFTDNFYRYYHVVHGGGSSGAGDNWDYERNLEEIQWSVIRRNLHEGKNKPELSCIMPKPHYWAFEHVGFEAFYLLAGFLGPNVNQAS